MNPKLKALNEQFAAKNARLTELLAKISAGSNTAEEKTESLSLDTELDTLETEIKEYQRTVAIAEKAASRSQFQNGAAPANSTENLPLPGDAHPAAGAKRMVIPASVKRVRVTSFKKNGNDEFTPTEKAYRFGQWFLGAIIGHEKSRQFCKDHGLPISKYVDLTQGVKVHTEGNNTSSGFLVPDEFENDLIDLREEFGVIRQWAKNSTMRSDTKSNPRRRGGLQAYFVDEGQAAQESMKQWDRVGLTARKLMCLAKYTSELDEDSVIDIGNDLAEEISYAFAIKEDLCGFRGDGTSPFGGIVGIITRMLGIDAVPANIKGLQVLTTRDWDALVLEDFTAIKARLPRYARRKGDVAWYTHHTFYHQVMERIMLKSGGTTAAEIAAGRDEEVFMGYPVRIVEVMDDSEGNVAGQIPVLFGNMKLAVDFGDRRATTLAMSEHVNFAEDEIALRGTERFDINVHDVGDTNKPGPVVGGVTP